MRVAVADGEVDRLLAAVESLEVLDGVQDEDLPLVDDRDPVAEVVGLLEVVGREDDREPSPDLRRGSSRAATRRMITSRPTVGSSRKRMSMSCMNSRATWTRRFWPPERSNDRRSSDLVQAEVSDEPLPAVDVALGLRDSPQDAVDVEVPLDGREIERVPLLDHADPAPVSSGRRGPGRGRGRATSPRSAGSRVVIALINVTSRRRSVRGGRRPPAPDGKLTPFRASRFPSVPSGGALRRGQPLPP